MDPIWPRSIHHTAPPPGRTRTYQHAPRRQGGHRWVLWLAAWLLTGLVGAQRAAAIPVCGDNFCDTTSWPPETTCQCPQNCGGSIPTFTCSSASQPCEQGSCDRAASGVDQDMDGIPDRLEYDLAHRFFPNIWLQDFNHDLDESYLYHGCALPYTVDVLNAPSGACNEAYECLEIRYGIAYYYDHGRPWPVLSGDHLGDAEFYAVLVQRTTAYATAQTRPDFWRMIRDFTAAHQGDSSSDSSRVGVYGSEAVSCTDDWGRYANMPRASRITLYAANRKHALYHTTDECDDGAHWLDSCDTNAYNMRTYLDVDRLQNVGSLGDHDLFDTTIRDPSLVSCSEGHDVWDKDAKFGDVSGYYKKFKPSINWCLQTAPAPGPCPSDQQCCGIVIEGQCVGQCWPEQAPCP